MAVDLKKLVDLRIDTAANVRAVHDVIKGGANVVNQTFKSVSTSTSNLDFVIQTPGLGVYMSRRVNVKGKFRFTLSFLNTSGAVQTVRWGRDLGICAFPFNSLISSATVQINTSSFNTQVQQTLPLLKRMCQDDKVQDNLTDCAAGLGQTAIIYPPGDGGGVVGSGFLQPAVSSTPFDFYKSGNPNGVTATFSNAGAGVTIVNHSDGKQLEIASGAGAKTVDVDLDIYEPLLCQPFLIDDEEPAFINTNLVSVRLNLTPPNAPFARTFRAAFQTEFFGLSDVTMRAVPQDTEVLCTFITPPAVDQIPTKCIYPTTFYNPLLTGYTTTTLAANGTTTFTPSNVITLNTAPDALAIYVIPEMPATGDGSPEVTTGAKGLMLEDVCLCIEKLDITWNNNPSLLVTLDQRELWRRTKQNGLPVSWPVFSGYAADSVDFGHATTLSFDVPQKRSMAGSPIVLALNKDIPVEPGVGAGVAGVYTLVVKASIRNQLPFQVSGYSLYVVPINSQYLVLNSGATSDLINTVATEAVVAATQVSGDIQSKPLLGGSMTGDLPIFAGYRGMNPLTHMIDMGARPLMSALHSAATPAASLVSGKRGRMDYT